jgi:hypothetical protein
VTAATARGVAALSIALLLAGCGSAPRRAPFDYGPYVATDPRSVLVAPVLSPSNNPSQRLFLATVTQPLAERGYYVFPVRMSKELEDEAGYTGKHPDDLSEAGFEKRATALAALFDADSVLFVGIARWGTDLKGLDQVLVNTIDPEQTEMVEIEYRLTDARGRTLWRSMQRITRERGGGDIFTEIWNFFARPRDPELELAREANRTVFEAMTAREGKQWYRPDPILVGPYHPRYEKDRAWRRSRTAP